MMNKSFQFIFIYWLMTGINPALANGIDCQFEAFSKHVFVINGSNADNCPAKKLQHPVTNPVAIIGAKGVVIVDPGSSEQVGQLVIDRLRLITAKPVVAIINTHIHGLYWLANHAIKEAFPAVKIYAHHRMIQRIQNGEGLFWLDAISGKDNSDQSKLSVAEMALTGGENLNLNGVMLKIHHRGKGHTDHDLMVEVVRDKILILGGLVVEPEVPSQGVPQDADFKGQIAATKYVIQLNMKTYIPGQGFAQGIELPERGLRFLQALYTGVERYYNEGLEDYEITQKLKLELKEFAQWYHFQFLGRVIAEMVLQIEQEAF